MYSSHWGWARGGVWQAQLVPFSSSIGNSTDAVYYIQGLALRRRQSGVMPSLGQLLL